MCSFFVVYLCDTMRGNSVSRHTLLESAKNYLNFWIRFDQRPRALVKLPHTLKIHLHPMGVRVFFTRLGISFLCWLLFNDSFWRFFVNPTKSLVVRRNVRLWHFYGLRAYYFRRRRTERFGSLSSFHADRFTADKFFIWTRMQYSAGFLPSYASWMPRNAAVRANAGACFGNPQVNRLLSVYFYNPLFWRSLIRDVFAYVRF
jgi:hypothetical protein